MNKAYFMPATGSTCKHQCNQTPSCRQNLCFKPFKVPRSYPKTSATCFGLDSYPKKHAAPSALSWQLLALSAECQYCQTRIHAKNTQMLMPASDCPSSQTHLFFGGELILLHEQLFCCEQSATSHGRLHECLQQAGPSTCSTCTKLEA